MENLVENKQKMVEDSTFHMKINSELKKEFNIVCVKNDVSMSEVVKDFMENYIKTHN